MVKDNDDGDHGMQVLQRLLQTNCEILTCGLYKIRNMLINLGLNAKQDCENDGDNRARDCARG